MLVTLLGRVTSSGRSRGKRITPDAGDAVGNRDAGRLEASWEGQITLPDPGDAVWGSCRFRRLARWTEDQRVVWLLSNNTETRMLGNGVRGSTVMPVS